MCANRGRFIIGQGARARYKRSLAKERAGQADRGGRQEAEKRVGKDPAEFGAGRDRDKRRERLG